MLTTQNVLFILLAAIAGRFLYIIGCALFSPLRSVPGPLLARFTNLWYFEAVRTGKFQDYAQALRQKYGPVVRVAPSMYIIDSPSVIKPIYGVGTKFVKSDWYDGWKHPDPNQFTVFTDKDPKRHAETKKRFQHMYSMSSLVHYEGYVNECSDIFDKRMTGFAESGKTIDMRHWFGCYAYDVIGNITYSHRFGFLDKGEDVDDIMASLRSAGKYSTLVGIYPQLHPLLFKVVSRIKRSGAGARLYIMKMVQEWMDQRKKEHQGDVEKISEKDEDAPQDFLDKLMIANAKDPQKVSMYHVYMMGLSNIIAGSDTTATTLAGILYHLLKNPRTLQKLRDEIQQAEADGKCSSPNIQFKESQDMRYLQAVMKEAMRLHSAVGLPMWRVVPPEGAQLAGRFFPGGTVVGATTYQAHYSKEVYGPDVDEFRPERWIEAEKEGNGRLKEMENYWFPFGLGSRLCLGKNISFLEMSKLIPRLVRSFDFELEKPNEDWERENFWFISPTNFRVKVKRRGH